MRSLPLFGRGATTNPANRFQRLTVERDVWTRRDDPSPRTELFRDATRSIISRNDSPDLGFSVSLNPYRGCEHGCAYCYARPTHEYLDLSPGLDFETKILVKEEAPALLRRTLASPSWEPRTLVMSGVTDPYQPVERRLEVTRRCLEVLAEFLNPVAVITKSDWVTRDLDHLSRLAGHDAAAVFLSITTLDRDLQKRLEPRAATPGKRLEALSALSEAGIPAGVMVAPLIPGLTDHELPGILEAAVQAGASRAGYIMLRLPGSVQEVFTTWLEENLPERKDKVLGRIRDVRGGELNDPDFFSRQRGRGSLATQLRQLFEVSCRRLGLAPGAHSPLSTVAFRRPHSPKGQFNLF